MLHITKQTINSNKKAIVSLAYNQFGATYVSVLNGKNRYLERANYGYAHLRFTKRFEKKGDIFQDRKVEDWEDTYVYYTTSTYTAKRSDFNDKQWERKLAENLSDRCFNIREEVFDAHSDGSFIYLVDLGQYFSYITKAEAKENLLKIEKYEGRNICTILLPNRFYKKTIETGLPQEVIDGICKFDAKYIQNVTYSKYRMRKGLKVELFDKETNNLLSVQYFVSTGEFADQMRERGISFQNQTVQKWARLNMSKELTKGRIWKFSFVKDINIYDISSSDYSSNSMTEREAEGHNDNHYILTNNKIRIEEECNGKHYASHNEVEENSNNEEFEELDSLETIQKRAQSRAFPKKENVIDWEHFELD